MILCRNIQRRRTLRWPIFPGVAVPIAAGDSFLFDASDFDANPCLGDVVVAIEDTSVQLVLH